LEQHSSTGLATPFDGSGYLVSRNVAPPAHIPETRVLSAVFESLPVLQMKIASFHVPLFSSAYGLRMPSFKGSAIRRGQCGYNTDRYNLDKRKL
jgi:hypothetical protein